MSRYRFNKLMKRIGCSAIVLVFPLSVSAAQTVTVEWDSTRQTIDGFGACDAWFADDLMSHADREEVLDLLFSTTAGAGLSILRHKVPDTVNLVEENAIAQVTEAAFARGCELVWASSWSPPAAWKSNGSIKEGGTLLKEHYQDYADYLEGFRARHDSMSGERMYAVSPQNEPGYKSWASCIWAAADFRDFIKNNLGPTLDPACRIVATEETNWDNIPDLYTAIDNDPAAREHVDIVAGHVYGGDPNKPYGQYGKPVWETEWSYNTSPEDLTINSGCTWAVNFWKLLVNGEVSAAHFWWMFSVQNKGKQNALINGITGEEGLTVSKRLWTIGNYSRFVRPGWKRIVATKQPDTYVFVSAFRNVTTGDFAVVAVNKGGANTVEFAFNGLTADEVTPYRTSATENLAELAVISAGTSFSCQLPSKSVTTFVGRAADNVPDTSGTSPVRGRIRTGSAEAVPVPGFRWMGTDGHPVDIGSAGPGVYLRQDPQTGMVRKKAVF